MPETEDAVRRYLEAATSGTDDAREALAAVLADAVTLSSPLGTAEGREAVLEATGSVQPMLAAATWSDPVIDGDVVTVAATLPPGSVLGTATLTFRFDGDGKIAGLQQALTPGAPPPATAVALDGAIADAVNGALDNGTPIIAAYVDRDGQPQLSLRGTVQVYSGDQVALWIRNPEGGLVSVLPENARLTFFYRDPAARTFLQIQGRGRSTTTRTCAASCSTTAPSASRRSIRNALASRWSSTSTGCRAACPTARSTCERGS